MLDKSIVNVGQKYCQRWIRVLSTLDKSIIKRWIKVLSNVGQKYYQTLDKSIIRRWIKKEKYIVHIKIDGRWWSMVVEYKTIDHHITIIPTTHYTHWWSSGRFLRHRVCVREREFRESLHYSVRLLSISSRPHPVNLQTISRLLRTLKGDNSHQVSETYG